MQERDGRGRGTCEYVSAMSISPAAGQVRGRRRPERPATARTPRADPACVAAGTFTRASNRPYCWLALPERGHLPGGVARRQSRAQDGRGERAHRQPKGAAAHRDVVRAVDVARPSGVGRPGGECSSAATHLLRSSGGAVEVVDEGAGPLGPVGLGEQRCRRRRSSAAASGAAASALATAPSKASGHGRNEHADEGSELRSTHEVLSLSLPQQGTRAAYRTPDPSGVAHPSDIPERPRLMARTDYPSTTGWRQLADAAYHRRMAMKALPSEPATGQGTAAIFHALSEPSRLTILRHLFLGEHRSSTWSPIWGSPSRRSPSISRACATAGWSPRGRWAGPRCSRSPSPTLVRALLAEAEQLLSATGDAAAAHDLTGRH